VIRARNCCARNTLAERRLAAHEPTDQGWKHVTGRERERDRRGHFRRRRDDHRWNLRFLRRSISDTRGTYYVQPANYWISTSAATWGWWHLIVSLIVLTAGFGVMSGAAWARWLGIIFVSIQALTNFLFIPAQPFWAITLILIDLWIIHSLFVHRREPV
jgi:hypothetical protein